MASDLVERLASSALRKVPQLSEAVWTMSVKDWLLDISDDEDCPPKIREWLRAQAGEAGND